MSWMPHFLAIRNLCNISPLGYNTTVIDGVAWLGKHHNLTLPELFSCQKAYETVSHTQYFFGVVVQVLLSIPWSDLDARFREEYALGWLLSTLKNAFLQMPWQ
mmetsp:Transcript_5487/g.8410  ORF Transcript_5487/g.8410 Transcript_5487/m.8410 type:complete len:103 (-) Transcript_5487:900-1208(-)